MHAVEKAVPVAKESAETHAEQVNAVDIQEATDSV